MVEMNRGNWQAEYHGHGRHRQHYGGGANCAGAFDGTTFGGSSICLVRDLLRQPHPGIPPRDQHAVAPASLHRRQRQGSHKTDQTQPGNKPALCPTDRLGDADSRLAFTKFAIGGLCGVRVGSWFYAGQPPSQWPLRCAMQVCVHHMDWVD